MKKTSIKVKLLASTPNALPLIYAAFRQCYSQSYVGDLWDDLTGDAISMAKKTQFVHDVLSSGHESPIEHVAFTFAIDNVSRALTHQLVRHRLASYSQQSQRYVDGSNFCYVVPPEIIKIDGALDKYVSIMDSIKSSYVELKSLLEDSGRNKSQANEDARFVLPQAAITKIVVTMNCRSLLHFFELRCCERAQWEIRDLSWKMLKVCRKELPAIFNSAGPKCHRLGFCPESEKFSCGKYPTRENGG